jgi:molecular chaperone HscB
MKHSAQIMNYFELYNIPVSLHVEVSSVKSRFYELSRTYHPDFFSNAPEDEQNAVLEKAAQVNKAFKIFSNPDETLKYVLQLHNLLEEEEKYQLGPDFLMEVMELNEQLEESGWKGDNTNSQPGTANNKETSETEKIKSIIRNFKNEIYEPVKQIVEHYQEGVTTQKELLQVKEYYYKKKYLNRILAGIR